MFFRGVETTNQVRYIYYKPSFFRHSHISTENYIAHEDLAKDPEAQGQGQALHLAGGVGVDTINTEIQFNVNIYK